MYSSFVLQPPSPNTKSYYVTVEVRIQIAVFVRTINWHTTADVTGSMGGHVMRFRALTL
jgi:hypothetical protein